MPAPSRHRQSRPQSKPQRHAPPVVPLGALIQEHDQWRGSLPGKPTRGALRDHWQKQDAVHAKRPDYLLWRELNGADSPLAKRQDAVELAVRALREADPSIHWAALALLPDVMDLPAMATPAKREALFQALRQRLGTDRQPLVPLAAAPQASALILWLARGHLDQDDARLWPDLQTLLQDAAPGWKLTRKPDLGFWNAGPPWPLSQAQVARRLALAIHRLVLHQTQGVDGRAVTLAPWHLTAWMLLRDSRPGQNTVRPVEIEVLLAAATTARLSGDAEQAAKLSALALHLLPPHPPAPLLQRCQVAALTLAEAGLECPPELKVSFDDLPFPGDPPASENGQAAARQYLDAADIAHLRLMSEVQTDPEWEVLRQAGVVLHHPLAALTWIARKAQSYALKKQHALLQSAATLAARHHRLTTLGRLLPHLPPSAERVLDYARTIRQNQRRLPLLRDAEIWLDWTRGLRAAWARLEADAVTDPEQLFVLHETLLDREVTTLRALPPDLRVPALRHLHSRGRPGPLVQTLAADPRQMQQLEHQRQVELWSVAAELRERPELAGTVWLSLVMRGEPAQGRCSLIVQGPAGRVIRHERLRPAAAPSAALDWAPLLTIISQAVAEVHPAPSALLVAMDPAITDASWTGRLHEAGLDTLVITFIPSWEWAFRVARESIAAPQPGQYLLPEAAGPFTSLPAVPLPPGTCVLLPTANMCDPNTRWINPEAPEGSPEAAPQRSMHLGTQARIISGIPVHAGPFQKDIVRLGLAQSTRSFVAPDAPLAAEQRAAFLSAPLSPPMAWHRAGMP